MNDQAARLRRAMCGARPAVLAGAHDGLTARLVEEAGFDAVWASGFEISASHGDEQALKVRAACDSRTNRDTVIIARTEALVLGAGIDEALERAHAYADAAADAVLVHSKRPTAEEVLAFARDWRRAVPLVAVFKLVRLDEMRDDERRYVAPALSSVR